MQTTRLTGVAARGLTATLLVLGLLCAARPAAADPVTLDILPSLTTVNVGDSFQLDISIGNIADLFDYQFDIDFNPLILSASGILDGGFLTSGGGTSVFGGAFALTIDNTTGLITILDSLLGPVPPAVGASGSGLLASIMFTALAAGTSPVDFANVILEDSLANSLTAQLNGGQVIVNGESTNPVPEPGTLVLMASGLALFGLTRGRRHSAYTTNLS